MKPRSSYLSSLCPKSVKDSFPKLNQAGGLLTIPSVTVAVIGLILKYALTEGVGSATRMKSLARTSSEGDALPSRGSGFGTEGCFAWGQLFRTDHT